VVGGSENVTTLSQSNALSDQKKIVEEIRTQLSELCCWHRHTDRL